MTGKMTIIMVIKIWRRRWLGRDEAEEDEGDCTRNTICLPDNTRVHYDCCSMTNDASADVSCTVNHRDSTAFHSDPRVSYPWNVLLRTRCVRYFFFILFIILYLRLSCIHKAIYMYIRHYIIIYYNMRMVISFFLPPKRAVTRSRFCCSDILVVFRYSFHNYYFSLYYILKYIYYYE